MTAPELTWIHFEPRERVELHGGRVLISMFFFSFQAGLRRHDVYDADWRGNPV